MNRVIISLSMSLDGFIAAPGDAPGRGLGRGGAILHAWVHGGLSKSFSPTGVDRDILEELFREAGAVVVGRRTFDVSEGWHGRPPGALPCFVVTHRPPEAGAGPGSLFTFVTDGIDSALAQARMAAGDRAVAIGGGANVAQQFLGAGLVDEIRLALVPVLLQSGIRLFDRLGSEQVRLEPIDVIGSPFATHLRYLVDKSKGE